jgi:hypothetical protein
MRFSRKFFLRFLKTDDCGVENSLKWLDRQGVGSADSDAVYRLLVLTCGLRPPTPGRSLETTNNNKLPTNYPTTRNYEQHALYQNKSLAEHVYYIYIVYMFCQTSPR